MLETVSVCLKRGIKILEAARVPESKISAEELLCHVLKKSRLSLHLEPEELVHPSEHKQFQELLASRSKRFPLQYLLETIPFRSAILEVGPGCLIPRPETEILVEVVLRELSLKAEGAEKKLHLLDVGTGSGNIAVGLTQERINWFVIATDISTEALQYAEWNAVRNGVSDQIRLVRANLWRDLEPNSIDAVVSNPPYLNGDDLRKLQPEIAFEPREALDGGRDGLNFYRRIIPRAQDILKPGGFVFFEVGEGQAEAVSDLLVQSEFQDIHTERDDAMIKRIVWARLD